MNYRPWRLLDRPRPRILRYLAAAALIIIITQYAWTASVTQEDHATDIYQTPTTDAPPQPATDSGSYGKIQYDFTHAEAQQDRLDAVKREFKHAWRGYRAQAWLSDSLRPISGGKADQLCGWSATLIDALDTLYIMGLKAEFEHAVTAALAIDFETTAQHCHVNFFESTIRYLGGLLAAYDLSGDERLKPKMLELGEILYAAFNTSSGLPGSHYSLHKQVHPDPDMPLADAFSFSLEFARLSQVTGESKYLDKVLAVTAVYQKYQSKSSIPGLWPERVDASDVESPTSKFVTSSSRYSLGALSDSTYEYLVKTHLLLGRIDNRFAEMWKAAAGPIKKHLLFRAYIPDWKTTDAIFAGIVTTTSSSGSAGAKFQIQPEFRTEHLACFAGGMFALSSRLFHSAEDLRLGAGITTSCTWAYEHAPVGIMPETFGLAACPRASETSSSSESRVDQHLTQCAWDQKAYDALPYRNENYPDGFVSSIDPHYGLRPEAIESVFVLYRTTGDPKYREIGWQMFSNIIQQTRTTYGHAALIDVMSPSPPPSSSSPLSDPKKPTSWKEKESKPAEPLHAQQKDEMESFWLAETLKYFYLLFSHPSLISLDEYVLNTEAHTFKLTPGIKAVY